MVKTKFWFELKSGILGVWGFKLFKGSRKFLHEKALVLQGKLFVHFSISFISFSAGLL